MATKRSSKRNLWVVCYDYAFGPFDLTTAYRRCAQANAKEGGMACQGHHIMIISDTKPQTEAQWFEERMAEQTDGFPFEGDENG